MSAEKERMDSSGVVVNERATVVTASYGLRQNVLSPLETLAQSVSTMAPSTSPTLTIPLVFALAGTGTWLAYALAMAGIALMALCIAAFARDSASPGSLYVYTRSTLPPAFSAVAAWALFFAYVMTASSVIGGFISYAYVFLGGLGPHVSPGLLAAVCAGGAVWIAWRDVKISTQTMLWIEAISVCLITVVVGSLIWKHGLHIDEAQLRLRGATPVGIRLGVMLALFSFVGFESATTLGAEAKEPLKTIPRAVLQSAVLAGVFFIACAYGEVLSFHGASPGLGESTAPMRFLSEKAGVSIAGPVIDAGVLVSMFAGTLACVIAAARVLMLMAHNGLAHGRFAKTHAEKETPGAASVLAGVLAFLPVVVLAERGSSGADIYAWMGTLAVYGFLTAYALVAVALPVHLRRRGRLRAGGLVLSVSATVATTLAMVGTVFPVPPAPYRYLPYVYVTYLAGGMVWYVISRRRSTELGSS
jgi:amino acid transporter